MQFALGQGYAVGEELTGGGMSRVFAARDLTLNRDVVVKTLPPELAGDISIERFKREIHFSASLQHPHIVPVHAAGDVDGLPYYTMPRVEGESLRHRLGRVQRFSVNEALSVVRDIGRALAYAHRRGLVHRDIKPENVLIADGMAVVTDFGIAKAVAASRVDDHPDHAGPMLDTPTGLTATGTSMGTPNYMAPEQAAGDARMDHRVDLYALGVVAYELLCGMAPFADRSRREQMAAQLVERPRNIAELRLDIPPTVSRLVMQCLEKEPDARPTAAEEIVRELEAALTGAPAREAVGDDPTVIRKAFTWYAAAFVAATALAWGAMSWIGLPDWVLPGTIVIMGLGLPLVVLTALTRYAAFQSTTGMLRSASSGGWLFTPTERTLRVAQALTWKRIATGGGASLGGFGVLIAAFMITRALGIGPAASLLATGQMTRYQPILLTDFTSAPGDSALARLVAEAVRIAFQESDVVRMTSPASVADALRRMRRAPTERMTLQLARDIAVRDGIGMIADGEVVRDGERLLLTVRLVAADSGNVLATSRAPALGVSDLVTAVDRLTRDLRSRIGESLRQVRATPALAKVTTPSFEALLLYTQGVRAHEREGDAPKARALIAKALEEDSTFAAAWRKLSVLVGGASQFRQAITKAFEFRHAATEAERLMIEAQYYWAILYDRPKSFAAFQALAERDGFPSNNYALYTLPVRQFARSESLFRALFRKNADQWIPYDGLFQALMNQGKWQAADSAARVALTRYPDNVEIRYQTAAVRCGLRRFAECEQSLDSLLRAGTSLGARPALLNNLRQSIAELGLMRGQISRWEHYLREGRRADSLQVFPGDRLRAVWVDLFVRHRPTAALARLDSIRRPVGGMPAAYFYALAGRPDTARSIVARYEAQWADSVMPVNGRSNLQYASAAIASAEGRVQDALDSYRTSDRLPDALPRNLCASCLALDLALVFDAARRPDSAITYYEQFLSTPLFNPGSGTPSGNPSQVRMGMSWWAFVNEAWIRERLAEMYENKGDRAAAIRHYSAFVELWQDADPELQPRVQEARARMTRLHGSRQ